MEERVWHNIRRNEVTRIPLRHVFVDTEAESERQRGSEEQWWRCGSAIYATRKRNGEYTSDSRDYLNPEDLWADVSGFASREGRTIVWGHNVAYDIRISSVLTILPTLGWTLAGHNIAPRGTWLEWKKGNHTLIFVDSFSVYSTSIATIGEWFDIRKPPLPAQDAEMGTWLDRCRTDCRILATAILRYLTWIKEEDLGNWQMTGNGQAWATFRHTFLTHKLTVHSESDALEAERRAMWTGRCEAYWHGELPDQRVYEYDFTKAYPTIAKDYELPVKLVGYIGSAEKLWELIEQGKYAVLADVRVKTDEPVVPTSNDGRILWPVGEFDSTLWDVEIRAAVEAGATVEIRQGWVYRKAPVLKAWGEWILGRLDADNSAVPAWEKSILKHWSRALIGRMAMTYQAWDFLVEMPMSKVEMGTMSDAQTGEVEEYMQVGTQLWVKAGRTEWKHSMPMVTGYVQAIARVQLWNVLRRMPFRGVLYCDTDSVFVTGEFREEVEEIASELPAGSLRLKRSWDGIAIYGPRQIITGTEVRVSGIPKRAEKVGRKEFRGEIWEGVDASIRSGHPDRVRIRDRRWTISGVDKRRKGTGFGWTEPIEINERKRARLTL